MFLDSLFGEGDVFNSFMSNLAGDGNLKYVKVTTTSFNDLTNMRIWEADDKYIIELELPGWQRDWLDVSLRDSNLKIEGKRSESNDAKYKQIAGPETRIESFTKTYKFGNIAVEKAAIEVLLKNGILQIRIKRAAAEKKEEAKAEKIEIK